MSFSRAINRLRKQCRTALAHMRQLNAWLLSPSRTLLSDYRCCSIEQLEPRSLLDTTGPQIIRHLPDEVMDASVDHLEVTFNEAIAPATFTPEDASVVLTTPALVADYDTDGYAYDVEVVGRLAYVADGNRIWRNVAPGFVFACGRA